MRARLFAPFPTDRRGEVPAGEKPYFDIPVYNDHEGYLSAIYSGTYIRSGQRFPDARRLSPEDHEALELFDDLANDKELRLDMEFRPGDMQFVHNHTCLHDRTALVDWPEPEKKRHLLRLWLAAPGATRSRPSYAPRYGSTAISDRGGIICSGTTLHARRWSRCTPRTTQTQPPPSRGRGFGKYGAACEPSPRCVGRVWVG